jgi:hypothetical protein
MMPAAHMPSAGLAPDLELLETMRDNDFLVSPVYHETLQQAAGVLQRPDEDDPVVWTHEQGRGRSRDDGSQRHPLALMTGPPG